MSLIGHVFKVRIITSFCPLDENIVDFALGCYGSHENEKHPGTKDGFPPQHVHRFVVGVSFFLLEKSIFVVAIPCNVVFG